MTSNTKLYIKDLKDHSDRMAALQVASAAIGVEVNSEVLVYVSLGLTRTAAIYAGNIRSKMGLLLTQK